MKIKLSNKLSLLLIALGFSCVAMAQQEPQFSQYMFNRLSYNPGYAGSSGSICAAAMYRQQWMGLKLDAPTGGQNAGSVPTDILFTFDMPVRFLHGGLGLNVVSDKIGYRNNTMVSLDYAFRMFWGEGNLSAGVEVTLNSSKLDKSGLIGNDPNDPALSHLGESASLIDGSVGLYYQVPGKYYLGLSVKNLLGAHSDEILFILIYYHLSYNCSNKDGLIVFNNNVFSSCLIKKFVIFFSNSPSSISIFNNIRNICPGR